MELTTPSIDADGQMDAGALPTGSEKTNATVAQKEKTAGGLSKEQVTNSYPSTSWSPLI